MTKVYLDDAAIDVAGPGLRSAIEAASAAAGARGRIVVEASADGMPVPDGDLAEPSTEPLTAAEVRFVSAEPRSMVRTVVLDVADAMPQLRSAQAAAAEHVQAGQMDQARGPLSEAMEIWSAAQRAIADGSMLLGIDLGTVSLPSGGTAESAIEALSANLAELQRSLTDDDPSALSDVLAYDLDERAEQWTGLMHRVAEVIDAARD